MWLYLLGSIVSEHWVICSAAIYLWNVIMTFSFLYSINNYDSYFNREYKLCDIVAKNWVTCLATHSW